MGLLDYFDPDALKAQLQGLLGKAPIVKALHGEKMPGGLADRLMAMPIGPDAEGAYNAALNVGPLGMLGAIVYHGGPRVIKKIDPNRLQSRDGGFYGSGFYVADRPELTRGYGGRVSKFELPDDAKVFNAGIDPQKSKDVANLVYEWFVSTNYAKAAERGKVGNLLDEAALIKTDPLAFKTAVDSFAVSNGYDAIRYSPGEVVIKNIGVLKPLK